MRGLAALFDFGSVALFALQFQGGDDQILIEAPVLEAVLEPGGELGVPEAFAAGELPDMDAFFLLGVAVVVFAEGRGWLRRAILGSPALAGRSASGQVAAVWAHSCARSR